MEDDVSFIVTPFGNNLANCLGHSPENNRSGTQDHLGLVIIFILSGVAIAMCGEDGKPLLNVFKSVSIVMMNVTTWIIHLAPIGVCQNT